ncbi:unnamed protein product, partial [Prorocentrum cordatum]
PSSAQVFRIQTFAIVFWSPMGKRCQQPTCSFGVNGRRALVKVAGPCGLCRGPMAFVAAGARARSQIVRALRKQQRPRIDAWVAGLPAEWRDGVLAAVAAEPDDAADEAEDVDEAAVAAEPVLHQGAAASPVAEAAAVSSAVAAEPVVHPAAAAPPVAEAAAVAAEPVVHPPPPPPPPSSGTEILDQGHFPFCSLYAWSYCVAKALGLKYGIGVEPQQLLNEALRHRAPHKAQWPGDLCSSMGNNAARQSPRHHHRTARLCSQDTGLHAGSAAGP